jgi:hypothetical protein
VQPHTKPTKDHKDKTLELLKANKVKDRGVHLWFISTSHNKSAEHRMV